MPLHFKALLESGLGPGAPAQREAYMIPTSTPDRKVPDGSDPRRPSEEVWAGTRHEVLPDRAVPEGHQAERAGHDPDVPGQQYDIGQPYSYISYDSGPYFEDILFATGSGTGLSGSSAIRRTSSITSCEDPIVSWQKKAALAMKGWYDAGYINKDVFANKVGARTPLSRASRRWDSETPSTSRPPSPVPRPTAGTSSWCPGSTGMDITAPTRIMNNGVALAANTKNAARTLQVLDRIIEDKSYNFLVYFGVEGKNYG